MMFKNKNIATHSGAEFMLSFRTIQTAAIGLAFFLFLAGRSGGPLSAQTATAVSETSASLGLGNQTRFSSGFEPIKIERTNIVPGRPFKVKATMDNFISSSKESFGGILNRYDTSQFGKFFTLDKGATVGGAMPDRTIPPQAASLTAGKTGAEQMYPPRLAIDGAAYPSTDCAAPAFKQSIDRAVRRILDKRPLEKDIERLELVFQGEKIVLRGEVKSKQTAETFQLALGMEPGVAEVVNEMKVLSTAAPSETDPLGWEKTP